MKKNLLTSRSYYKPFEFGWAYEAYKEQSKMHWIPDEVPLGEDVKDWNKKLTEQEKNLLTQLFRFFTQGDVDVAQGYLHKYIPIFGHKPELAMMLSTFASMEAIHVDAYALLLDTIGMPETEYKAFSKYEAMKAKHDYLDSIKIYEINSSYYTSDKFQDKLRDRTIAKSLAVYSAFTEGLQLFSSFAMLLAFPRQNKMKGMGQIVSWSVRDESLHVKYMIQLFREFIKENKEIWTDDFKAELYQICRDMVELEDNFIDLSFEMGNIEGLTKEDTKLFVRHIADRRLLQLGLKANYKVKDNPLPWFDDMIGGVEHANFFEARPTAYSKGSVSGSFL